MSHSRVWCAQHYAANIFVRILCVRAQDIYNTDAAKLYWRWIVFLNARNQNWLSSEGNRQIQSLPRSLMWSSSYFLKELRAPNRGIFAYYPVQQMCVIWISSIEPTTFVRSMKSSIVKWSGCIFKNARTYLIYRAQIWGTSNCIFFNS